MPVIARHLIRTLLLTTVAAGASQAAQAAPTWTKVANYKLVCPSGYIPVPEFTLPSGTRVPQFCVMKYEAKKSLSTAGNRSIGGATGALPISVAAGLPWVYLTWQDARSACAAAGMQLITENQWLSIAHQLVSVGSNWSGGAVGNGWMYTGNNDLSPGVEVAADPSDANGYYGTGDSAQSNPNQRRTLTLPNNQVIWDFSGNVWEWVDYTLASRYHGGTGGWMSYNVTDGFSVATNVPLDQRPPNNYNVNQGMGRYYDGPSALAANSVIEAPDNCTGNCAQISVVMRGDGAQSNTYSGVFALWASMGRSYGYAGFRCVK